MEIDDHDFQVVRKNLNILSVLILTLAYTDAHLHEINFLGIEMELDGVKLYKALFIGYLYFIWRYLTKLNFRGGFWNDFLQYYLNSDEGVKKEHNYMRYQTELINSSERLKWAIETNDKHLHLIQLTVIRFPDWPLTRLRLSAMFNGSGREGMNDLPSFNVDHEINTSGFLVVKKLVIFCVKYDKFGDYLFPLIPVILNIGFFLFKPDWQGGLQSWL